MALDKNGLVGFWDFTKGNAKDLSGNSNDGVLNNSEGFVKTKNGWGYLPQTTSARIAVNDTAELQLTEGTFVVYADFRRPLVGGQERFIYKRDAGGTNYDFYVHSTTSVAIYDGSNARIFNLGSSDYLIGRKTIIFTKSSGSSVPKLYVDGVYHSDASGASTFTANDADLYLCNSISTTPSSNPINGILIYNTEKTAAEVAAIHNEVIKLKTINTGTRGIYTGPSVNPNDSNAVSGYNMQIDGGKVKDNIGSNHGTVEGKLVHTRTPWGYSGLDNSESGGINLGSSSDLNFTTESFGCYMWVKGKGDFSSTRCLFGRGTLNTSGYGFFTIGGNNRINLQIYQPGATQSIFSTKSLVLERYYLVGFFSEAGGNNYVYINGEDKTNGTNARTNPSTHAGNAYISKFNSIAYKYLGSISDKFIIGTFANKAEYEAAIQKEYNRVANKVIYKQDFESAAVTQAARGAGSTLPGTDVEVVSGTFKISTDTINGKTEKVLECATAGVCAIPVPQGNAAYGSFECYFNKADASSMNVVFISDNKTYASANGYQVQLDTDEACDLEELATGTPSALFTSAASVFSAATWTKLNLTRTTEGIITVKLDDTNVTAATGNNPVTDITTTTSKYILFDLDAGDKIALITKKFGVAI